VEKEEDSVECVVDHVMDDASDSMAGQIGLAGYGRYTPLSVGAGRTGLWDNENE